MMKTIKHNIAVNGILTLVNMAAPMVMFACASRILTVESMGRIAFVSSFMAYATLFANMGITTYGIRACAGIRDDRRELSKTVRELALIHSAATASVMTAAALLCALIPDFHEVRELIFLYGISIISNVAGMNWLYSALEEYDYITVRSVIFRAVSLLLLFLFVRTEKDELSYTAVLLMPAVASNLVNFIHSRHYISCKIKERLELRRHIRPMFVFCASTFAINIYTNLDVLMLRFMKDVNEVAMYNIAVKAKVALTTVLSAVSLTLLPRLSNFLVKEKVKEYRTLVNNSISLILSFSTSLSVFFIMKSEETITLLGGGKYTDAVPVMKLIMPVLLSSGLANVIGHQILIPQNKEKLFLHAVLLAALVDFLLNCALIPGWGAEGAAFATTVAEASQLAVMLLYAGKVFGIRLELKWLLSNAAFVGAAACSMYLAGNITVGNAWADYMIAGLIYFGIYGAGVLYVGRRAAR